MIPRCRGGYYKSQRDKSARLCVKTYRSAKNTSLLSLRRLIINHKKLTNPRKGNDMADQSAKDEKRVAFYQLLYDQEAKNLLGAMLVLDELGKPQEFRVTFPVKPTMIQRQLYGDALVPHVGIELCGKPLYDTLKSGPQLLVTSEALLLGLADEINIPVVYLERAGESLVVNMPAGTAQPAKQKLTSHSGRFNPVAVSYPSSYAEDERAVATEMVSDFFAGIDLLEPFNRINVALETLRAQDERFR